MPQRQDRRRFAPSPILPVLAVLVAAGQPAVASDAPSGAAAARQARIDAQLAAAPDAVPTLADWSGGLPQFDARFTSAGFPVPAVERSLEGLAATPAWEARKEELAKLLASTPELRVDDHPVYATPQFVRSTRQFLTPAAPGAAPEDVVARYLADHAALFEINALEVPLARVARDYITDHNGVRHLTFQQQLHSVDLYDCLIKANVMPDGRLINISSSMLPRPAADFAAPAHKISAADALIAAARHAGVILTDAPEAIAAEGNAAQHTVWKPMAGLRPEEPLVTEKLYFPMTREDIRAAYSVVVPVPGVGHTYDIIVDAADGSLLSRNDRLVWDSTQPASFRVYTSDGIAPMSPGLPAPANTQAPLASRELVTVNPADIIAFNPNGWINDNDTETLGNNIDAHLDLNGDNVADTPRPSGGASRIFDFPMVPSQDPSSYRDAAVTQLFYLGNRFHDRLFALGFNEAAGNFQAINFSGAGITNDRIQADSQDGISLSPPNANNANFSTAGADGSTARVQMYIFTGSNPDRDGSFDGDIVYHEFAHGVSIRLHHGFGSTNIQSRGMGEGWSDYFGISLLAEASDDPSANYTTGGYTTYQLGGNTGYLTNYYFGIRRFPYSVNLNINPLTFADIDVGQFAFPASVPVSPVISSSAANANEVHNQGEVWCNALLECRTALWNRDGFSANQLLMQLVIDGMKLSPANPNFLQARDAILQADLVDRANADRTELWTAFAKRGMGASASSPASTTTSGVTEAYNLPFTAIFTYPDGIPAQLAPEATTVFRVQIAPDGLSLTADTAALLYSVDGGAPVTVALTPTGTPDEYTATLPALGCSQRVDYTLRTGTSVGDVTSPGTGAYHALVYTGVSGIVADDFEIDRGWTVGPNTATAGVWTRVDPIGTAAAPEDDHTASGTLCWVTGQGVVGGAVGSADVDGGYTTLTSPAYNLSGAADVQVSYWRWFSTGAGASPYADTFRIEVSTDNGATWTSAQTVGPGGPTDPDTNPGWRFARWRLADLGLTPSSQVKVRFIVEDAGSGSIVEAALDDFTIEQLECIPPNTCRADVNDSGDVTVQDIFDFLALYFAGQPTADFNNSGDVTVQDIFEFLTAYFTGCP